jgi:hypothetical protein
MKKILAVTFLAFLVAAAAEARYIVVLKDGTSYVAKAKWTVVNGKAIVNLENGQSLQLDPSLIDTAKSEQATKMGLTNARVLDLNVNPSAKPSTPQKPSLGSQIKLKTPQPKPQAADSNPAPASTSSAPMPREAEIIDKFHRAYENVSVYERTIKPIGATSLRAELTVDTEDRVFNVISATAFLLHRNAGIDGVNLEMVELFMKTPTGGSGGRFQMTRADAEALDQRKMSQQDYFLRKVIY